MCLCVLGLYIQGYGCMAGEGRGYAMVTNAVISVTERDTGLLHATGMSQCPHSGTLTDQAASFQNIPSPCCKRIRKCKELPTGSKSVCLEVTTTTSAHTAVVKTSHLATQPQSGQEGMCLRITAVWCMAPMTFTPANGRHFTLSLANTQGVLLMTMCVNPHSKVI